VTLAPRDGSSAARISSLTPHPKCRRSIYRSVKDINQRLERALAAVLELRSGNVW